MFLVRAVSEYLDPFYDTDCAQASIVLARLFDIAGTRAFPTEEEFRNSPQSVEFLFLHVVSQLKVQMAVEIEEIPYSRMCICGVAVAHGLSKMNA
eukprot:6815876-Prymnesium_polylepis.1